MGTELRELMIYQSPPELGALFTEVQEMTKEMGKEQKILIAKQMQADVLNAKKRAQKIEEYKMEFGIFVGFIILCIVMGLFWTWLHYETQERWPDLKNKTYRQELEKQKRYEVEKIKKAIQYLDEQNMENNKELITPK
jgi:hypothetical protein